MARKIAVKSRKSCCPLTTSKTEREKANKLVATVKDSLPSGLAAPALRALAGAGYKSLEQLAKAKEEELSKLHGMGPKALEIIRAALRDAGQSFRT